MGLLAKIANNWSKTGLKLPLIYDHTTGAASFRLFCAYISFITALGSVVALHWFQVEIATWTAIGLYSLSMVFYMLKRLSKASIDLDDKSIALESAETEQNT